MREFSFYTSVAEPTLYRYHIRESGPVYYVTISVMQDGTPEQVIGSKVLRNITRNDVIHECLSHCRRRSGQATAQQRMALLTGLRNWVICSVAVLTFIRLMMIKN
jgi:hypothetical protein